MHSTALKYSGSKHMLAGYVMMNFVMSLMSKATSAAKKD
jgi:hypothetical protein